MRGDLHLNLDMLELLDLFIKKTLNYIVSLGKHRCSNLARK